MALRKIGLQCTIIAVIKYWVLSLMGVWMCGKLEKKNRPLNINPASDGL